MSERDELIAGLHEVAAEMQRIMRAHGCHEPDWAPLEHVMPEAHRGWWMFMGYWDGVRQYKHSLTRRYLQLIPRAEALAHAKWGQYLPENRSNVEAWVWTNPAVGVQLAHIALAPHGYRNPHSAVPGKLVPVELSVAISYAYEDVEALGGTRPW